MSLEDQNRLRCITQAKEMFKNQSSYLKILDGIFLLCARDFPTYSQQGVLVTITPLKNLCLVTTSQCLSVDLIAQWQSIGFLFCRSLLQILIYSRHRRFESYFRQIFFIYFLNNILYYHHFFINIGV